MRKYEGKFAGKLEGEGNQQGEHLGLNLVNELKGFSVSRKTERKLKTCWKCNGACDIDSMPFEVDVLKDKQVRKALLAWYLCRECNERQRHPYTA
ncbi:hypothetical protein [Bacillus wiedmannii]|uniref:hypothetical protein n=1 Tax=Bacillus wiedmannii TaxID=1890302 RepID=UPI003D97E195